jgi:microcystin-dependent protein
MFNVPNMGGRVPAGAGLGNGLTIPRNFHDTFGNETQRLTIGQMPAHDHDFFDPKHSHAAPAGQTFAVTGSLNNRGIPSASTPQFNSDYARTADESTNITFHSQGNSDPIDMTQPSVVLNYIIKT